MIILLQQVCHRDLKLENTLLDGNEAPHVKICDFGYSKVVDFRYKYVEIIQFDKKKIKLLLVFN